MLLHASGVCFNQKGVLFVGKPGAGKSDLALRCIDIGAVLVSDDQVDIKVEQNGLSASPPAAIAGLLEVRGVGILKMPYCSDCPIHLIIQLVDRNEVERLPEPAFHTIEGKQVPLLKLCAFDASTPVKIKTVLEQTESFFLEKE